MSGSWSMKAGSSGGGDWELPPSGNMAAVCIGLIDLGTHQEVFQNEDPREVPQLCIVWELPGMVNSKTGRNHVVCNKYNASLGRKANLRKMLESWRGVPIKDDEEFDIFKVVGAPCLLQVAHSKTNGGSDIYKISAVTGLPKGMPKPVASYPLVKYRVTDGPNAIPTQEWLPHVYGKVVKDIVQGCIEFSAKNGTTAPPPAASNGAAPPAAMNPPPPNQDADDCPF